MPNGSSTPNGSSKEVKKALGHIHLEPKREIDS